MHKDPSSTDCSKVRGVKWKIRMKLLILFTAREQCAKCEWKNPKANNKAIKSTKFDDDLIIQKFVHHKQTEAVIDEAKTPQKQKKKTNKNQTE